MIYKIIFRRTPRARSGSRKLLVRKLGKVAATGELHVSSARHLRGANQEPNLAAGPLRWRNAVEADCELRYRLHGAARLGRMATRDTARLGRARTRTRQRLCNRANR